MVNLGKIALNTDWYEATKKGTTPISMEDLTVKYIKQSAIMGTEYSLLKPDILIGSIPFYDVIRFEVARSYDLLQYRSIGANFLAQQEGGNVGISIEMEVVGIDIPIVIAAVYGLYYAGRIREKDNVESKFEAKQKWLQKVGISSTKASKNLTVEANQSATVVESVVKLTRDDYAKLELNKNYELTVPEDLSYEKYIWHNTFPIMTQYEILFDMYIQTVAFNRRVEYGRNVMNITLLVRQYKLPTKLVTSNIISLFRGVDLHDTESKDIKAEDMKKHYEFKRVIEQENIVDGINKLGMDGSKVEKLKGILNGIHRTVQTILDATASVQTTNYAINKYNISSIGITGVYRLFTDGTPYKTNVVIN